MDIPYTFQGAPVSLCRSKSKEQKRHRKEEGSLKRIIHSLFIAGIATLVAGGLQAANGDKEDQDQGRRKLQFTIKNVSPADGLWIMRPWIGLHDGEFSTFMVGQPAPSGVQHIAEDGITGDTTNPSLLTGPPNGCTSSNIVVYNPSSPCQYDVFRSYHHRGEQVTIGGPTAPGATLTYTFNVNPNDPKNRYLSYLVMIIPSNDAFFGTDSAHPIRLYDKMGHFSGGSGPIHFFVYFTDILDAGTEYNSEIPMDTAFLGQTVPGTGVHPDTDNPLIHMHDPFGAGIVNGSNMFPAGHTNVFLQANAPGPIAEVTISELP
jgi:hypothetical protein